MLKLYGFLPSRSNRPHWALEEIGAPYEFYQVDAKRGDAQNPAFLKLNPGGKVPALVDGDLVVTESAAICNYLGEKFPESKLTPPAGSTDKARYGQWMFFVMSELEQPLWTKAKHSFAIPEKYRVPAIFETTQWEFKRAAIVLSQGLGQNEFLVGGHITMADIMAAHTLAWASRAGFPLGHDNLQSYLDRMLSRPSFERMLKTEVKAFSG